VARTQLAALGVGHGAVDHRLTRRLLHPVHRGVFALGHSVLSREGRWMAAVLAAGPGAVLSYRSAAALWQIRDTARARTEVSAPGRRRRADIETHRIVLAPDEVTTHCGIPVTTPARTLLDLAAVLTPHQLERALHEAEYRRLASPFPLDALIARHPTRRGTVTLRRLLQDLREHGAGVTRSVLEDAFLPFLDAHAFPRPKLNEEIGPYTVDALWPGARLVVELDSRQAHDTRTAFESDRARDRDLTANGYRVLRITHRQLHGDAATIGEQLRALLGPATSPAAPTLRP
jgi:very-short-patch-repair endonuclease